MKSSLARQLLVPRRHGFNALTFDISTLVSARSRSAPVQQAETLAPSSYRKSVVVPMPGPPDVSGKPKANNVYAQKIVVKQAPVRGHMGEQLQDLQKQRLLQPDSPRSPSSQRAQQVQPVSNHSPRQAQQSHQQLQSQSPQQASDQSDDDWTWPQQTSPTASQQEADLSSQPAGGSQLAQNGSSNAAQRLARPKSPFAADQASPSGAQDMDDSQQSATGSRSRTGTASPRTTNDTLVSMGSKNVSWQDAQGHNLCHYREFEPSEVADSEGDDTDWHAQKKGCCMIM